LPSDYHLFSAQKQSFDGHTDDFEVKTVMTRWLATEEVDFNQHGIKNLVRRYDKFLICSSAYVEK
jgi:hypothetical protein